MSSRLFSLVTLTFTVFQTSIAQITMPAIFGDHMVLQQKQSNPIWGWTSAGETVRVSIHGQSHTTEADENGYFKIMLKPLPVGGPYQLHVEGEKSSFYFDDVLVGEVWICSGQSNMAWALQNTNAAELSIASANYPDIRIITVPRVGTQEPQPDFEGVWDVCSPQTIKDFSAVGYLFGRRLHNTLGVPIGLIDNAWGGSAAEAWIKRDVLETDGRFDELMAWWKEQEQTFDHQSEIDAWEKELAAWESGDQEEPRPRRPNNILIGNHRPANIYNGVLHPTIGFGIRGVIWYQGESNATRAAQYRDLFPLMIEHWRDEWGQGDFSFYYVQLADFMSESDQPEESTWAELREAQTMTLNKVNNVGQAVIIDVGEGRDIHPRNKQTVANRLARLALAKDYQFDLQFAGPSYQRMKIEDNKIILTFNQVGKGLYAFDTQEPQGFAIAGDDQKFVWAEAKIIGLNEMEVWSDVVQNPVAVRYGWANNPVCNMYNRDGLPMTPFRTDEWPGITEGVIHR